MDGQGGELCNVRYNLLGHVGATTERMVGVYYMGESEVRKWGKLGRGHFWARGLELAGRLSCKRFILRELYCWIGCGWRIVVQEVDGEGGDGVEVERIIGRGSRRWRKAVAVWVVGVRFLRVCGI